MSDTLALMEAFLGTATPETVLRVRSVDASEMRVRLGELFLDADVVEELIEHWDETRSSSRWAPLLAALVSRVERDRGDIDAPIPIWDDLDPYGPSGRLLYYYLFALQVFELQAYYREHFVPEDVAEATIRALARHGETHRLVHGSTGVDAGWWMMVILRGEILQIGALKFHQVHLDVGTLSPRPWLDASAQARHGEGFRSGDVSLGLHIPARTDLSPGAVDASLERARSVLSVLWPRTTRRLLTCQSWMLDERLVGVLGENSNIVSFQRRFNVIEPYEEDDANVAHFVFGRSPDELAQVRATSRLQRTVLDALESGATWRNRTGWIEFD